MRFILTWLVMLASLLVSNAFAAFNQNTLNAAPFANTQFVPVEQAFPFRFIQQGNRLFLDWQVKDGYYLYQDRLSITAQNLSLGEIDLHTGEPYHDEFFGDVTIYTTPLNLIVPLNHYQVGAQVRVSYQGCAKAGFCYPPETRFIDITAFADGQSNVLADPSQTKPNSQPINESSLTHQLTEYWWTPALFLLLGIGLAFTPCVLPMYPILTGIVLGGQPRKATSTFWLSFIYVQGMALTYTLLGLVVASAGIQFQAMLQHPYLLISFSLLFVLLALAMFGAYSLQLPNTLHTWLNRLSQQQQGGRGISVFTMGAISGLICSPCTTAPLSGALLYVAQTGDLLIGGITLYALAVGMGIPLILVAVFGQKLLPKSGAWMQHIKTFFGFVLLAAPLFLLERLLPEIWIQLLWSGLGIALFGWLYHVKNHLAFASWQQSALGIIAILGLVFALQPWLNQYWNHSQNQPAPALSFIRIHNVAELNQQLALAKAQQRPVMLDFYADWCVACKEFEKYTFSDPKVAEKLAHFVLLQADVTPNQAADIELLTHQQVLGLPTLDFWDAQGQALPQARLSGFLPAKDFLPFLEQNSL